MTNPHECIQAVTLSGYGVILRPLSLDDQLGLQAAAADGQLWRSPLTSVPEPQNTLRYIETALGMQAAGNRLAFAVVASATGRLIGSTSYHDIVPSVQRVEIGWTWYAQSHQRTHVNTAAKLLLMRHAFEVLGCRVVGWRTDCLNVVSQRAIERLGAKKDGTIRGHALRRDGTVRDTVFYSMTAAEWPHAQSRLLGFLDR